METTTEFSKLERVRVKLTEGEIKKAILDWLIVHNPRCAAVGDWPVDIELYEEGSDNNPRTYADVIFRREVKDKGKGADNEA